MLHVLCTATTSERRGLRSQLVCRALPVQYGMQVSMAGLDSQAWLRRHCGFQHATPCACAGDKLQLDLHLCNVVRDSRQGLATDPINPALKLAHTSSLLDLVYFLWFEQQQLERGARLLAEVGLLSSVDL